MASYGLSTHPSRRQNVADSILSRRGKLSRVATLSVIALSISAFGSFSSGAVASSPGFPTFDPSHSGGTVKLVAQAAAGTLDPKINYTGQYWELYQASYDGLLAFAYGDGKRSFDIVPDLATALPKLSNGGKTLNFTLRKGVKFSNGQLVTVADVKASFERIFKVLSPTAGSFYNGIVGADKCLKTPATCKLDKGVVVNAAKNSIVINLVAPDETITSKLAVPHAVINPASSPSKDAGTTPIPTTGPYMFKSYSPTKSLIMVRNPYFKEWSHDAQPAGYPDMIEYDFGVTPTAQVTAVENNQASWAYDPIPADRLNELGTKYASQVHINPLTAMWYLPFNVNIAPFNNLKARQAVSYAIDRAAMVKIFGGTQLAAPVCSFLPPNFPGHVDYCYNTKGASVAKPASGWSAPDLALAKQLVKESGTAGASVGIVVSDDDVNKSMGVYLQSVLNSIGYKATVKAISGNIQFTYIQNTKNKVQISVTQWYQDYPAASDFLNVLLGCASFTPNSDSSINMAGYCNKAFDAKMAKAIALGVTNHTAANIQWGKLDEEVMKDVPAAVAFTPKQLDFISSGTKNYHFSLQYKMYVSQLQTK
jgi:peptide/nickel transport system substrate-binding protein